MAAAGLLQLLAARSACSARSSCLSLLAASRVGSQAFPQPRTFATGAEGFGRKDVIYNLDNKEDPEAIAAIKEFQRQQFQAASKGPTAPPKAEADLELTSQVERKYKAAQIVESGIQNTHVPLSYDKDVGPAPLKRYLAQLMTVGKEAGFDEPAVEIEAKVASAAAGADTMRDLLSRMGPYTSPDYHAALNDALASVEADTGSSVTLNASSAGYKKFADKVKAVAQAHKLPWQMLLSFKQKLATADEDQKDTLTKDYKAWLQSAQLSDIKAELEDLKADAARLVDIQLTKTADTIKKEVEQQQAGLLRKLEASKGTKWAQMLQRDLQFMEWFDAQVAQDPANGPRAQA